MNPMTNGAKSSSGYRPYTGPTLLTAGSAGVMERSQATNTMTNGSKSSSNWKPYSGPTLLTAGCVGRVMIRRAHAPVAQPRPLAHHCQLGWSRSAYPSARCLTPGPSTAKHRSPTHSPPLPSPGPTRERLRSAGVMERETAYNTTMNGSKSSANWTPHSGPTLLTAGYVSRFTHRYIGKRCG